MNCSQKQQASIKLTLSERRIDCCLLTVKSFCLPNKYFSIYSDMFIKKKAILIKTKAIWQKLECSISLSKFLCATAAAQLETSTNTSDLSTSNLEALNIKNFRFGVCMCVCVCVGGGGGGTLTSNYHSAKVLIVDLCQPNFPEANYAFATY